MLTRLRIRLVPWRLDICTIKFLVCCKACNLCQSNAQGPLANFRLRIRSTDRPGPYRTECKDIGKPTTSPSQTTSPFRISSGYRNHSVRPKSGSANHAYEDRVTKKKLTCSTKQFQAQNMLNLTSAISMQHCKNRSRGRTSLQSIQHSELSTVFCLYSSITSDSSMYKC